MDKSVLSPPLVVRITTSRTSIVSAGSVYVGVLASKGIVAVLIVQRLMPLFAHSRPRRFKLRRAVFISYPVVHSNEIRSYASSKISERSGLKIVVPLVAIAAP